MPKGWLRVTSSWWLSSSLRIRCQLGVIENVLDYILNKVLVNLRNLEFLSLSYFSSLSLSCCLSTQYIRWRRNCHRLAPSPSPSSCIDKVIVITVIVIVIAFVDICHCFIINVQSCYTGKRCLQHCHRRRHPVKIVLDHWSLTIALLIDIFTAIIFVRWESKWI